MIRGDKDLLCRAIGNILTNSQVHNPDGCGIMVETDAGDGAFVIRLEDDGIGIGEEELQKLQSTPHYMMSDGGVEEPRHGLGLLIVRQNRGSTRRNRASGSWKTGGKRRFCGGNAFPDKGER